VEGGDSEDAQAVQGLLRALRDLGQDALKKVKKKKHIYFGTEPIQFYLERTSQHDQC
jgi:hypothetical protein